VVLVDEQRQTVFSTKTLIRDCDGAGAERARAGTRRVAVRRTLPVPGPATRREPQSQGDKGYAGHGLLLLRLTAGERPEDITFGSMATSPTETTEVSADERVKVAEPARSRNGRASSVRRSFLGKLRMNLIHPYPEQDPDEVARAKPFLDSSSGSCARTWIDRIDREGNPDNGDRRPAPLGAFGIKIRANTAGSGCRCPT